MVQAAEQERARRIEALAALQAEEDQERMNRQAWAREAVLGEQKSLLHDHFLSTMTNTMWFHEVLSHLTCEEYEVVCPFAHAGCKVRKSSSLFCPCYPSLTSSCDARAPLGSTSLPNVVLWVR